MPKLKHNLLVVLDGSGTWSVMLREHTTVKRA